MRVWPEVPHLQTRSSKFLNVFPRLNSVYLVSCICRDRRECAKAPAFASIPRDFQEQPSYIVELFLD